MVGQWEFEGVDLDIQNIRTFKYDRVVGAITSEKTGEIIDQFWWAESLSQIAAERLTHPPIAKHTSATYIRPMHTFIELPIFTRYAEDYFNDEEMADLQRYLSHNAKAGDVVPGSCGVRKLRWARAGMGKRGGVRILYYVQDAKGRIWLLTVYAKSARENIPASTLNLLREVADHAEIE